MNSLIDKIKKTVLNHQVTLLLIIAVIVSIFSVVYYYQRGFVLSYNDAESHLNIAKRVVGSLTPGLGQLGGNWLPVQHILMLPFIWNDFLWRSGLAGSFVSMFSFIICTLTIFKLIKLITNNDLSSWFGTLIFMSNPGILYMQSTPMGELPLLAMLLSSVFFFTKWSIKNDSIDLVLCAIFSFFGTLIRYDAWLLVSFEILLITLISIKRRTSFKKLEGSVVLFSTLALLGILFWTIWNYLIFNNPLYFVVGKYSAQAQQLDFLKRGQLISYHNIFYSLLLYTLTAIKNVGLIFFFLTLLGVLISGIKTKKDKYLKSTIVPAILLWSPFIFYVITLYFGVSIILIPEAVPNNFQFKLFNVRYGIIMLPAASFFIGILFFNLKNFLRFILILLVILQFSLFFAEKRPIVLEDAIDGLSARKEQTIEHSYAGKFTPMILKEQNLINKYVRKNYDYGFLMLDDFSRPANPIDIGTPMDKVIYIGNHPYWEESLENPTKYVRWFIVRENNSDSIWNTLRQNAEFKKYYYPVYKIGQSAVYKRRQVGKKFVSKDGNKLVLNGEIFKFVGVNSYDLAYKTKPEIEDTIRLASDSGIKVIRFWGFGEGFSDGFQPKLGVYNQSAFSQLGYVVSIANKYHIKLIITLSNYWEDYGGAPQYLIWKGLSSKTESDLNKFFTNKEIKKEFENYVKRVVTYKNPYTQKLLKNDPTIMAWELMNEPRSSSSKELSNWLNEVANNIKIYDQNHMIFPGVETFLDPNYEKVNYDLPQMSSLDSIDAITAHVYQQREPIDFAQYTKKLAETSRNSNKPLIIEEIGFHKKPEENFGKPREELTNEVFNYAKMRKISGILLWNWSLKIDDSFGISPVDPNDNELIKIIANFSKSIN